MEHPSEVSAVAAVQVMAKVTVALAAFSLACVLGILVANLTRGEPAGYSIVVFFVVRIIGT